VLPDANALYGTCVGATPSRVWADLLDRAGKGQIRLAISECTLAELEALLTREAVARIDRARSAEADLRAIGLDRELVPPPTASGLAATRLARFRSDLRRAGAGLVPAPPVGHLDLTRRAAERRPPFDAKGGGYRDALLWHTALDLASDASVLLVTGDRGFRGDAEKGTLHPDLRSEAGRKTVRLAQNLAEVVQTLVAEETTLAGALDRRLREDDDFGWDLFKSALGPLMNHRMLAADLAAGRWSRSIAGIQVNSVELPGETRVLTARKNLRGETETKISMRLNADLDLRVDDLDDEVVGLVPLEQIQDIGRGLIDPRTQIYASLDVDVTARVVLDRRGHVVGQAAIECIAVPQGEQSDGQLEFPISQR
jgi:hypothetical protein